MKRRTAKPHGRRSGANKQQKTEADDDDAARELAPQALHFLQFPLAGRLYGNSCRQCVIEQVSKIVEQQVAGLHDAANVRLKLRLGRWLDAERYASAGREEILYVNRPHEQRRPAALRSAEVAGSALFRSLGEECTGDLTHLGAFAFRAMCALGSVLADVFVALEKLTAFATSVFVGRHEYTPLEIAS